MIPENSTAEESNGVMESREVLCTEWKSKLESCLNRQRQQGEVWALVCKKWFQRFEEYMSEPESPDAESSRPGKIQNHDLLDGGDKLERDIDFPVEPDWKHDLKKSISEDSYIAVPPEVWEWLHKSFGGGPCIPRYCLESGPDNTVFDIPLTVYVYMSKRHAKLVVPRTLEFHTFRAAAESALKINEADSEKYHIITDLDVDLTAQVEASGETETLDSLNVVVRSGKLRTCFRRDPGKPTEPAKPEVIPLGPAREPLQFDLNKPNTKSTTQSKAVLPGTNSLTNRPILSSLRAVEDRVMTTRGRVPGMAGLQNLGNTCFMNSALQCLFHCVPVLQTFLSGTFVEDLNVDNPLGKGGEMAKAFGSLLQKMWRGDVDYISPEGFKHILGKHAVQFQSYDQHDSQEFLSYLLDMLHEDLNRVKKKPYIEEPDDEGRPDDVVAKESWDTYRARNDSAIVDHFQGLLKSTLDCPNCGHLKRKFDPFMYLSVPLPGNDTVLTEVTVVPMDGASKPQLHCVKLFKNDTVGAFIEAMAIVLGIKVESAQQRLQAACVSLHNRVTLLDDMSADLPQKSRWSHDRLVVYSYPEADTEEGGKQPSKKAVIMPPAILHGSKCPLPLLLRVPGNAIELESESAPVGASMYRSSNKRYLLRTDCELAKRVEDLLKPFKRLRSGTNLVYSPTASCPGQAEDSTMADSADGAEAQAAPQGVGEGLENGVKASLDRDGDSPMLSVDTGEVLNGTDNGACGSGDSDGREGPQPSSDAVEGVATATGAFSIQSPGKRTGDPVESTPSWLMETSSAGSAGAGATANGEVGTDSQSGKDVDTVQGVPADEPTEGIPCATGRTKGMVKGLLGGQEFEAATAVPAAAQAPSPPSPPNTSHTGASVAPNDSIIGAVPAPEPLDMGGNHVSPVADAVGAQPDHGSDSAAGQAADGKQPAVRLMVVTDAGYQIGFTPQADADTRFFKLDVPVKEVVDLFDVDAMSQVERHDSMAQLDIRSEYSLEDCIKAYLASEVLGPRDTWHCPKCRQDVRAKKALDLWCLPEVLIIHLKRFSYSGNGYYSTMSSKIDNLVDFPLKGLDMTKFVHAGNDQEAVYDCFGVSNHFGSVSGGHYTAYCAHERSLCADGQKSSDWNCYNDRSVVSTTPGSVVTSSAYVLFYRRRSKSEADPDRLVQQCKDHLQKEYPTQAAEAMGEEPLAGDVRRTNSPSTSTDVMDSQAARAKLGDGLIDSNPLPPALQAALSPFRPADESMSGGEPYTPEPNAISLENPTPITSSQSDGIPQPEETEMKTFGMSTAVRMEEAMHGAAELGAQDIASDIADLSDVGEAPEPGLSVYSQGGATSEDGNDGLVNDSSISNDDAGSPGGEKVDSVNAWLHEAQHDH